MNAVRPAIAVASPRSRSLRTTVERLFDRLHARGDAQLRALGFEVRTVPGWFGWNTHRSVTHPAVRMLASGSKPRSGAVAIAGTTAHNDHRSDRPMRKEVRR